jgi:hypothetical protein
LVASLMSAEVRYIPGGDQQLAWFTLGNSARFLVLT